MEKRLTTIIIIVLVVLLAGYIITDVVGKGEKNSSPVMLSDSSGFEDQWRISRVFEPGKGRLLAVSVADNGNILLGGDSFISCYSSDYQLLWDQRPENPVSALAVSGNFIYCAENEIIRIYNQEGAKVEEWGPFQPDAIITSISANDMYVAFADAASRSVYILNKKGIVQSIIGKSGEAFIIPSNFFDIALSSDNFLYAANTGNRRIEKRNFDGTVSGIMGKAGTGPEGFCGCCNPAHFSLIPGGFVTSEKGINRIKILNGNGVFIESVSSVNNFKASVPLDVASVDGKLIFAANPSDSKLYVFERK
jgi:hypothetical protein